MVSPAPASAPQKTPLFEAHGRLGARMVEFGGWLMPVFYSGILEEHRAVRAHAGLFDISHMGEFTLNGADAAFWLNHAFTNDISKLAVGEGQYTLMTNDRGGVIDDLIVYRTGPEAFLLVVNASKIEEDREWVVRHIARASGVEFRDRSAETAGLALQGPKAAEILVSALALTIELPHRNRIVSVSWNGHRLSIARTGYTGEDGFEIFCPSSSAEALWETLLAGGREEGLLPCGLGCRDTLRLEACYPLNGQDLSDERTPIEAGLGFFVSLDKAAEFPGKAVLARQKAEGPLVSLVALRPVGKGAPPRPHYPVYDGARLVGEVTSGTLSPTFGHGIALAYVETALAAPGGKLELEVRGQRVPVEIVRKPFYKKKS